MRQWQCPVCKSSAITLTESYAVCHGCGHREYLYDYANAHDNPMPHAPQPDVTELEDRIGNLEAISAERGSLPRKYQEQFDSLRGELANLRQKIVGQPTKPQPVAHAQPAKPKHKLGVTID